MFLTALILLRMTVFCKGKKTVSGFRFQGGKKVSSSRFQAKDGYGFRVARFESKAPTPPELRTILGVVYLNLKPET